MVMVASLVYFAIDTIYSGAHPYRLYWCLGFFVFGAVLVARISIEMGRARAGIYAVGLGGACFLAMLAYVTYPPGIMSAIGPIANLLLMGIERMMHTGKPTWPSERTLLTVGILDTALRPKRESGKRLDTPWLDVSYSSA